MVKSEPLLDTLELRVSATPADASDARDAPGTCDAPGAHGGAALRDALRHATEWTSTHPAGRATVVLEPGVHRVAPASPDDLYALSVRDAARIDVEGAGATVLFTDPHVGGFDLARTTAVSIRDLTLDWEHPSFTQGVITEVDPDAGALRFRAAPGFPDFADRGLFTGTGYGTLRTAHDGRLKAGVKQTFLLEHDLEPGDDGTFGILLDHEGRARIADIEVGDGFVVGHRGEKHGISLDHCALTVLERVTLHAAPCAAVISHESSATVLRGVVVARRPGSGRWISTNADAFHCQGGRLGPVIEGCTFEGMHDDGVNLYVHAMTVTDASGGRVQLAGDAEVVAGDVLQFVDGESGTVLHETTVRTSERDASGAVSVHLDEPIGAAPDGTEVYNRSNSSPGFAIRDCTFADFRGIGVRLKASEGEISRCTFRDLSSYGLWVANDPGWSEGPLGSRDVVIRDNVFVNSPADEALRHWSAGGATVVVETFDRHDRPGPARVHRGVRLVDNSIQLVADAAIAIGGAVDVIVDGLVVDGEPAASALPTVRRRGAADPPEHPAHPSSSPG